MRSIKFLFLSVFSVLFLMTACDDGLNVPVDLGRVDFDIPLEVNGTAQTSLRADGTVAFAGTYTLSLADPMFNAMRNYIDNGDNFKLVVSTVTILIQPELEMKFKVSNFKAEAFADGELISSFFLKNVEVSKEVVDSAINIFVKDAFQEIQKGKTVTFNVSGNADQAGADALAGKIGAIKFLLDLVAQVKVATVS